MSHSINRRRFFRDASLALLWLAMEPKIARARQRGGINLSGPPKHFVILGGGLAGLAAGLELKRAGHTVTILEARKQPGGRLRTLRDFADGLYAEAGPLSFPQSHEFTFGYATEFGLPLRPAFSIGLDSIAFIDGSVFRIDSSGQANIPISLTPQERQAGVFGMISLYLEDYIRKVGNPRKPGWPPDDLAQIDQFSLQQLLEDAGASQGAIDIIGASQLGILGYGLNSISALDGVVSEAIASDPRFYEIAGGNDKLATAMKKKVKKQFKKKAVVRRIEQDETSVTITFESDGVVQTLTADRAICTLPFSILKNIEVSPAFSPEKLRAINELGMTPVTRTYLQFQNRVWEQSGLSGYGLTDTAIQNTYSPTMTQQGPRGILTSYTGGQRAITLASMGESDRQSFVLRRLGNVFGRALNDKYESGTSIIWQDEPFARGGFAYFAPGQMTTLLPVAQQAEGRIHFAGEHTSAWHGWMNGALESGNRAAEEVNAAEAQESFAVRSA